MATKERHRSKFDNDDGVLLIDKPAGMTSFGIVARVRRHLTQQTGHKVKVGHTGTLDPFATGLMILVVGKATKRAAEFSKLDKVYETTIKLGETSSTGDPEGEITPYIPGGSDTIRPPSSEQVERTLRQFIGEISQTPPIFSAIKINGVRAYKLARLNKTIEMPDRKVKIYSLDLLEYEYPILKLRAHVSSGTYIRSLANDIGQTLGMGAYCRALRRVSVGTWSVTTAQSLPADSL